MAGKGSKIRPGANLKKYWDNFPTISNHRDDENTVETENEEETNKPEITTEENPEN